MREILFRGKRIENGEWVESNSIISADEIGNLENETMLKVDGVWVNVISETVSQYTGLADKNGKRIFVGDIIKFDLECDKERIEGEVVYDNAFLGYFVKSIYEIGFLEPIYDLQNVEIRGNTHEEEK